MSTAIKIENVSKQYRLGVINTGTLSHDLNRWWTVNILHKDDPYLKIGDTNDRATRGSSEYVWALKDINMEIEQGDVVGIIGKNGAGKSTLLKILSRVTKPTTGTISYKGRIASLLEVGTGFHPEMTGRENIYMNGAIMGMSRAEVSRKLDEIVDFAGVERYLDTPVKRYSSGMTVRLGFAIAAHLEPEILVVDEVLAVGDAEFQKKAIGKMQDVSRGEGRTVLFVSHNMAAVQRLCKHGVILTNGVLSYSGNISDVMHEYLKDEIIQSEYINSNPNTLDKINLLWAKVIPDSIDGNIYTTTSINVNFAIKVNQHIDKMVIGFNIISSYRNPIARVDYNDINGEHTLPPGEYEFHFVIPKNTLSNGDYTIRFDIAEQNIRNYATEMSNLSMTIILDEASNVNTFNENMSLKNSIVRGLWLKEYKKI